MSSAGAISDLDYRLLRSFLRPAVDRGDLDDVVQEAILSAWKSGVGDLVGAYRTASLRRHAHLRLTDYRRRAGRVATMAAEVRSGRAGKSEPRERVEMPLSLAQPDETPDARLTFVETLRGFPPAIALTLLLRVAGYSIAEVAADAGVTQGAISLRLRKPLAAIRADLGLAA